VVLTSKRRGSRSRRCERDTYSGTNEQEEQEEALSQETTPLSKTQPGRLMSPETVHDAAETVPSRDSRKRRGSFLPAESLQSQINYVNVAVWPGIGH
jgi:hypothetical protein